LSDDFYNAVVGTNPNPILPHNRKQKLVFSALRGDVTTRSIPTQFYTEGRRHEV